MMDDYIQLQCFLYVYFAPLTWSDGEGLYPKKKKTPDEGTKDSFSTTKNKEKPQSLRQAFEI